MPDPTIRAVQLAASAATLLGERDKADKAARNALSSIRAAIGAAPGDDGALLEVARTAQDAPDDATALAAFTAAVARKYLPDPLTGAGWDVTAPAREWLVDGWLPAGELSLLTGPGSAGKGVLVGQLAAALSCDRGPLGAQGGWLPAGPAVSARAPDLCPEPVTVVVGAWEDDRAELLRRRERLHRYGGCTWARDPSISGRLHALAMRGYGPLWAPPDDGSRHIATVGALTESGKRLMAYAEDLKARLLVLDPIGLCLYLSENDRALVSAALDALAGWSSKTGCAVLLVGHPAKATEGEGADYSGSTAWRGSVRALWTLRAPDKREVDHDCAEWSRLVGSDPGNPEKVAALVKNKANYGLDGISLTLATRGKRAGWHLADPVPAPSKGTANGAKNGSKRKPPVPAAMQAAAAGMVGADVDAGEA